MEKLRKNKHNKKIARIIGNIKAGLVSKIFWGRSSWYRRIFHFTILLLTIVIFLTDVSNKLVSKKSSLIQAESVNNIDILLPGGTLTAVEVQDVSVGGIRVFNHVVEEGESLDGLAKKYKISKSTIRWANLKTIGPFSDNIIPGWELKIPSIDGVLYRVQPGDTIWKIANNTNGDAFIIAEMNDLVGPDYELPIGEDIMVPDGKLQNWDGLVTVTEDQLAGAFTDPLSNPKCAGYNFAGGINSYPGHNGVDLAKWDGCPIRSIAAGTVYYAGWEDISGYTVKVDHGGGVKSYYYHGDGEIWVKVGQHVEQGQDLMMMGCTGNCRGPHLHLTIKLNGQIVDPVKYVPIKYNY
jgi:hypothetical protein